MVQYSSLATMPPMMSSSCVAGLQQRRSRSRARSGPDPGPAASGSSPSTTRRQVLVGQQDAHRDRRPGHPGVAQPRRPPSASCVDRRYARARPGTSSATHDTARSPLPRVVLVRGDEPRPDLRDRRPRVPSRPTSPAGPPGPAPDPGSVWYVSVISPRTELLAVRDRVRDRRPGRPRGAARQSTSPARSDPARARTGPGTPPSRTAAAGRPTPQPPAPHPRPPTPRPPRAPPPKLPRAGTDQDRDERTQCPQWRRCAERIGCSRLRTAPVRANGIERVTAEPEGEARAPPRRSTPSTSPPVPGRGRRATSRRHRRDSASTGTRPTRSRPCGSRRTRASSTCTAHRRARESCDLSWSRRRAGGRVVAHTRRSPEALMADDTS